MPPARAPAVPPLRDRLPPSAAAATARCRAALPARGEPSSAGSVPPSRRSHLAAARAGVPPNVRAWKEPRGLGGISREGSGTAAPDCAPAGKTFSPRHGPRGGHLPQRSAPRHSEWRRPPVRASTYLPPAAAEGKGSAPSPQRCRPASDGRLLLRSGESSSRRSLLLCSSLRLHHSPYIAERVGLVFTLAASPGLMSCY